MVREFTVLYSPGPAFVAGNKLEEQVDFRNQVAWWKGEESGKRMKLIGVPATAPDTVLAVWYADSFEDAQAQAGAAPFVRSGVLTIRTAQGGPRRCVPPR